MSGLQNMVRLGLSMNLTLLKPCITYKVLSTQERWVKFVCLFVSFLSLAAAGSSEAVTTHAYTDDVLGRVCITSAFWAVRISAEVVQVCWAAQPAWLGQESRGSEASCSSSSPSRKAGALPALFMLASPGQFSHSASAASLSTAYYG